MEGYGPLLTSPNPTASLQEDSLVSTSPFNWMVAMTAEAIKEPCTHHGPLVGPSTSLQLFYKEPTMATSQVSLGKVFPVY